MSIITDPLGDLPGDEPGEPPSETTMECPRCGATVPVIGGRIAAHIRPDTEDRCRAGGQDPVHLAVLRLLAEHRIYGRTADLAVAVSGLTRFVRDAWTAGFAKGLEVALTSEVVIVEAGDPGGRAAARFFGAVSTDTDDLERVRAGLRRPGPRDARDTRDTRDASLSPNVVGFPLNGRRHAR